MLFHSHEFKKKKKKSQCTACLPSWLAGSSFQTIKEQMGIIGAMFTSYKEEGPPTLSALKKLKIKMTKTRHIIAKDC